MIIHTSADRSYWDTFGKIYVDNNRQFLPDAKISLTFVGRDSNVDLSGVDVLQHDPKDYDDIKSQYNCTDSRSVHAYYGLSRFFWIPTHDDVMIRDLDTLVVNQIDQDRVDQLLKKFDVVNLIRKEPTGRISGLGAVFLSRRVIGQINEFACNLCNSKPLYWPIDEEVKFWLRQNLNYHELEQYGISGQDSLSDLWVVHAEPFFQINDLSKQLKLRSLKKVKSFGPDSLQ